MIPIQVSEIPIDKTTLELVIVAEQAWQNHKLNHCEIFFWCFNSCKWMDFN